MMATLESRLREELGGWRRRLPTSWRPYFQDVELAFDKVDSGTKLRTTEKVWPQETNEGRPSGAHLFKAFRDLAPADVRVIVFGNDPYTRLSQATGRSFEQGNLTNWKKDIGDPSSGFSPSLKTVIAAATATSKAGATYPLVDLRVVFNEDEFGYDAKKRANKWSYGRSPLWVSDLALELCLTQGTVALPTPKQIFSHWANQGVLWINRTLTYTKWDDVNKPGHRRSHQRVWAPFTERVIDTLVDQATIKHRIVFALWGSEAKKIGKLIKKKSKSKDPSAIQFVETGHPQWTENFFRSPTGLMNPLEEINKAVLGKRIQWVS